MMMISTISCKHFFNKKINNKVYWYKQKNITIIGDIVKTLWANNSYFKVCHFYKTSYLTKKIHLQHFFSFSVHSKNVFFDIIESGVFKSVTDSY